ncbi:MAG: hypothetical protein ABJL44_13700 [Algibacter sp.]
MKNLEKNRNYYLLVCFALILFSCSSDKEKFIIEEIEISSNGTSVTKNKFEITKFGSHFSYSSSSNDELQDVAISFNNKQLSTILDKLEYSYSANELRKNPLLKIDYYKENITKEKAVKEIISQLKKTYDL